MKKDEDESNGLGCALIIVAIIVCTTAYEIAKLFVKGTP